MIALRTIPEVAAMLRVSERTVRREIKRGKLKAKRIGRSVFVIEPELERYRALPPEVPEPKMPKEPEPGKRRPAGTGGLFLHPRGYWLASWGPKRDRKYRAVATREEGEAWLAEQLALHGPYARSVIHTKSRYDKPIRPRLRFEVMRRDGFRCTYCGRDASDGVKLEVDHVIPLALGGTTHEGNLRTACRECNVGKGGR